MRTELKYYANIQASEKNGKRYIDVEVIDKRISQPLHKPHNMRWNVDDKTYDKFFDKLMNTSLQGPTKELKEGHEHYRPVARLMNQLKKNGSIIGRYELLEDDPEWADYSFNKIKSGEWSAVSPDVTFGYNYSIDDNILTLLGDFDVRGVNFVPKGAFPNAGVVGFNEGIAASVSRSLTQSEILQEKNKMKEEELQAALDESVKSNEELQAKVTELEQVIKQEKEKAKLLAEQADVPGHEVAKQKDLEIEKMQKQLEEQNKFIENLKDTEITKIAAKVADKYALAGHIGRKDVPDKIDELKKYDKNYLEELDSILTNTIEGQRYQPKISPSQINASSLSQKERRRLEGVGYARDEKGEKIVF